MLGHKSILSNGKVVRLFSKKVGRDHLTLVEVDGKIVYERGYITPRQAERGVFEILGLLETLGVFNG